MKSSTRTEQVFLILTALADQPRHGYGIAQEVAQLSDGRTQLKVGTLYGALERLTDEGLLEPDHDEVDSGRLRRYYRLTDQGVAALAEDTQRIAANAKAAAQRLQARGVRIQINGLKHGPGTATAGAGA
ncbi:MAG TPA: PadR family transcriptional regulator [Actinocrinis sp.]|uniref:PadR family transcriptional regulator n=1 Tax=Actinocrinis sp. TaxID=1920516 RepID=UPI002D4407B0|nr:PadR family transcriptional regulator [Actinocrinis sp.]HZU55125.1 PadR family transcriptional regulator [Actinocrinis sp.]